MINPIFSASLLRRMRSFRTILLILLYSLLPLIVALSRGLVLSGDHLPLEQLTQTHQFNSFLTQILLQFALTCLVSPAMTAGCLTGERERQTMDMLLVTNTGSIRIVMGKWMEAFAFMALLIFSALPMTAMTLALAGMNTLYALFSTLYLMLMALALSALGLLCSALCRRTIASTVTAYILLFTLGVLFPMAIMNNEMPNTGYSFMYAGERPLYWYNYPNPILGFVTLMNLLTNEAASGSWNYTCPPETYLVINITLLMALSLGLCFLSAAFLRPRSKPQRKKNA